MSTAAPIDYGPPRALTFDAWCWETEIWSLGFVNAYFDITEQLSLKLAAIREFKTQLATVDYLSLAEGLAKVRGFHGALRDRRSGAAEAFFAMPNHEYCDLVRKLSVNVAENS
jgi:LmbE family N-acetylglucosaminyl deacetylase